MSGRTYALLRQAVLERKQVSCRYHGHVRWMCPHVLGTKNVVSLCARYDVEHFVMISTDKAVRPTSVMGATNRIAEHIVHP